MRVSSSVLAEASFGQRSPVGGEVPNLSANAGRPQDAGAGDVVVSQ